MKHFLIIIILVANCCCSFGQKQEHINFSSLSPDRLLIGMDMMIPVNFNQKMLNREEYWLELKGDSMACHLPYMGTVYNAPVNEEGLTFSTLATRIEIKKKKKNCEVKFYVRRNFVMYYFNLKLYNDNTAYLFIKPSNAQSISFSGDIMNAE